MRSLLLTSVPDGTQGAPLVDVRARVEIGDPSPQGPVVVVLDASASLDLPDTFEAVREGVVRLVDGLDPSVPVGIVAVQSDVRWLGVPGADREVLRAELDRLRPTGTTALHDGILLATTALEDVPGGRMVLVADGGDSRRGASREEAQAALDRGEVTVWGLAVATLDSDREALDSLAGGAARVLSLDDPGAIPALLAQLAPEAVVGDDEIRLPVLTVPGRIPTPVGETPVTVPVTAAPPPTGGVPVSRDGFSSSDAMIVAGGILVILAVVIATLVVGFRPRRDRTPWGARLAERLSSGAEVALDRWGRRRGLGQALDTAGMALRPGELVMAVVTFGFAGGVVTGILTRSALLGVLAPVVGAWGVAVGISRRIRRRREVFAVELPDVLTTLATALRAGYSLGQSLENAVTRFDGPVRDELVRISTEVRLGRDLGDAVGASATRMASVDLAWVATALEITAEVGGDGARMLDTVAATARERLRLRRDVRALTAEGRLSAIVLSALPPLLATTLVVVSPGYFEPMGEGIGPLVLVLAAVSVATGWWWMRRLVGREVDGGL